MSDVLKWEIALLLRGSVDLQWETQCLIVIITVTSTIQDLVVEGMPHPPSCVLQQWPPQ